MWVSCLFCFFLAWCCSFQARAFKMLENLERADKDLLCGLWTRKWVARIIGMLTDIALRVEQPATDDLISANQLQCMHWTCAQLALCGKPASGRLHSYFYQRVIFFSAARVTDVLVSSSIHAHMACSSMQACGSSVVYQRQSRITVNRKTRSKANNGRRRVNTLQGHCRKWKKESRARRVLPLRHFAGWKADVERCQGQLCVTSSYTSTCVNDVNSWLPSVDLTSINNS